MNNPKFPVGFRFLPKEEELVVCYLKNKATNSPIYDPTNRFQELDLYNYTPEQLREIYGVQQENEMYIFVKKVLKYQTGKRLQRRTVGNGFWRASTKEIAIKFDDRIVGHRRSLVYHRGEGHGEKTNWLMYEYRLPDDMMQLGDWLLCKVYLNEKKKIKTKHGVILEPTATLSSSGHVGEESASASAIVSRQPECSSYSSSTLQWTVEQSAAMVNSGSLIEQLDSDETITYWDVTMEC